VLGPAHRDTLAARVSVGVVEVQEGKYREAEEQLRGTCQAFVEAKLDVWERYSCQVALGASLAGQKRPDEAEPLLLAAYQGLRAREASIPAASKPIIERTAQWLARLYTEEGKPELAAQWKKISPDRGN